MSLTAGLRRALPGPLKSAVRSAVVGAGQARQELRYAALDLRDALTGRNKRLTPPHRLWGLVTDPDRDFHAPGEEIRDLLISLGLKPDQRVLDVGCGCGRVALPLTEYLTPQGGFDGFDIMPAVIRWCQDAVTPRFPNFRFVLADLHSDRYHPDGASPASRYVFPYLDGVFDYVFLGSVFTHMLTADVDNYLGEIARVMKPGGQCVISYYLLNPEREAEMARGGGMWSFPHHGDGYRAEYPHLPEAVVGFDETDVLALYRAKGLDIVEIRRGVWPTRPIQDQDIVIARKPD